MRFRIGSRPSRLTDSVLVYRPDEFSFDVEPQLAGFTSVVVNELSLEVDETGKLIKVWGYCPHLAWAKSTVMPPRADRFEVFAISDERFLGGVSQSVNSDRRWPVLVDPQSGWVCLESGRTATSYAEVSTGVILGLDDDQQLAFVYLKPKRLPELR
jgi:hypothetical protein